MSAPYFVGISYPSGNQTRIDAPTFEAACDIAAVEMKKLGYAIVSVLGDGVDYDCDQDGFFMCDDGLSDAERDELESRGIS